jgi:hypothetical protein
MIQAPAPSISIAKSQQLLLRLPNDLACRFAQVVSQRQRSRFLIDLLRRELDRESNELVDAALRLNAAEQGDKNLAAEDDEWLDTALVTAGDDGFDAAVFEQQYKVAKATSAA